MKTVVAAETNANVECTINNKIKKIRGAKIQVPGFASDCRKNVKVIFYIFQKSKKAGFLVQKLFGLLQSSSGFSQSV